MKVLHVVASGDRRGAEIFAADLIRALQPRVEQRVVVLRPNGMSVDYDAPTISLDGVGPRIPGLRVDVAAVRGLAREIVRWRPDVVQAHGGETLKYVIPAGRRSERPFVFRSIGLAPRRVTRGPRRAVWARLSRRAARVVAVADAVRRESITTFGVPPERVTMIPNGADADRLVARRSATDSRGALALPASAEVVLSVGALTWEKDPLGLIQVAARVISQRPRCVFLLVGDGPLREAAQRAVARAGLRDRARLLGSRDDVPDLMSVADLLLLGSTTEGMPGCVIEAGMLGVPTVSYRVGGVEEVVVDGDTGRLARAGRPVELSDRVIELLGNTDLRRAMGLAARARCRSMFDIRSIAPSYLRVYEEVCE